MFNQNDEIRGRGLEAFNRELENEIARFEAREQAKQSKEEKLVPVTKTEPAQTQPGFTLKLISDNS